MAINETDLRGHVVWYMHYFWREVEWVGRDMEIDKAHDKDCGEQKFQLAMATYVQKQRRCNEDIGAGCCNIII